MKQPSHEADAAALAGSPSLRAEGSFCPNSDADRERARKGAAMNAWFPCYANDLLGSMRWKMMTAAQRGAYWQLICWQMQAEDGHLPADIRQLSALADVEITEGDTIAEAFPVQANGRRANIRALREWQKRHIISQKRSKSGGKGAASRWQTDGKCHSKGVASAATSTSTSIPIPTSTDLKPSVSAPSDAGASATERKKAGVIDFDGEGWIGITDKDKGAWKAAYPACDIARQIAAAAEWAKSNPKKAKKNWRRFLTNWLDRSQQKGGDEKSMRPPQESYTDRAIAKARAEMAQEKA